jgi:hypothetical protein
VSSLNDRQSGINEYARSPIASRWFATVAYVTIQGAPALRLLHLDHFATAFPAQRMPAGAFAQLRQYGDQFFMSPDGNRPSPRTGCKNEPKQGKKAAGLPLFRRTHLPVFSLLFALKENYLSP